MTTGHRKRLDEILIAEGLVSEVQIREALMRQKAHGGKVGSQLLYHRYIDEAGLVKALTIQFGCEGVVLSRLEISEVVIGMIPKRIALARKLLPFDFDPPSNTLKVACENPTDPEVVNELKFVARGRKVKLYVAAELPLDVALSRYYLGEDISLDESLSLQIPDEATETGKLPIDPASDQSDAPPREAVLLVTDEEYCAPLLQSIFERDDLDVVISDSADDAIEMIGNRRFRTVFIKDTVPGDYIDLIDRLRKISPRTRVRYYESAAKLLLSEDAFATESELLVKNLDLFTTMMSSAVRQPENHSGRVGHYADRLCRKLGLPDKDRLQIVSAAYLHDIAKFHYAPSSGRDYRATIKLSTRLLQSLNYPPVVVEMLRSMYKDLGGKFTKRLPIEALGGNILTIIDIYCENVASTERLLLDKFDAIKKKFRDLTGRLFMAEVVEAFVAMLQEEMLAQQTSMQAAQVMLLADGPTSITPIHLRLKNEGFRTITPGDFESFVDLFKRSRPDMVVLTIPGDAGKVTQFVERLHERDVDLQHTPTFVLVDTATISAVTSLLEKGIEDVLPNDGSLDLLVVKMQKIQVMIQARQQARDAEDRRAGASGRLADMNLIDLLQALGPSRKTARITVVSGNASKGNGKKGDLPPGRITYGVTGANGQGTDERLTLYLDHGAIIFAEYKGLTGAEAVYETIGWTDGHWTVEPITRDGLPAPNTTESNESILMEGCRLLDERLHAGKLF